jgi:hypothetical protein
MPFNNPHSDIEALKQFFVGLLDGGWIQVNHWRKKILQFRVVIKLKFTPANLLMLQQLSRASNIGRITVNK